ncbi:MAG TPA: hypothetical protein VFI99_17025 [Nocardioides sp.]|nr:hypothetical protein [Nocardioides sp.]
MTGIKHVVGAIGALALLAACGGSDFTDSSATTIQKEATKDMQAVEAVHMEGSVNQQDNEIGLDLSLTTDGDCTGTVSRGDSGSAQVVTLDDTSWFKPDEEFWQAQAGEAADQIISTVGDKWVQLPEGDQSFASFCDLNGLLDQIGDDQSDSESKKGETEDVNDTEAIKLTRDAPQGGGTITVWVATDDPHHILKVEQAGGDSPGTFTFSEFDQDASIEAPADDEVITVEELQQQTQQ